MGSFARETNPKTVKATMTMVIATGRVAMNAKRAGF